MRASRAMQATVVAVALAVLPGAIRLLPADPGVDRAAPGAPDEHRAAAAPPTTSTSVAAEGAPTPPPPAVLEVAPPAGGGAVPIQPPGDLSGEVAPAVRPPAQLRQASAAPAPGEVFALVIGIDDYPGTGSDLRAAVADADTIDAALARFGVPEDHRVVLRDGQARRDHVVAAISSLVARAGPGSTMVFAYAGHVRKLSRHTEALVTVEGDLITDEQLAAMLAPASAERVWLMLATCFAGGFTEALAPGRILTAAADADSLAYERSDYNASFLVHHMVREGWLEGRAGPSVQQAFAYAHDRIVASNQSTRPVQLDHAGSPLLLRPAEPPPDPGPAEPAPPEREPEPEPERSCVLGVLLCSRR